MELITPRLTLLDFYGEEPPFVDIRHWCAYHIV
jgi:hypothetical protein